MSKSVTFARFVTVPENRSAFVAVRGVADRLASRGENVGPLLVYLHGPPGSGKSHLVTALVAELRRAHPTLDVVLQGGGDWKVAAVGEDPSGKLADAARDCDVLALDDLHHLPVLAQPAFTAVLDHRLRRGQVTLVTALRGPQPLGLPARLASRLAGGLVVALESPTVASRVILLQEKAQRRQLVVSREVLAWLARHLSGTRQLDGALASLQTLSRVLGRVPDVQDVADHFRELAEAARPTVDRIVRRVADHFHVEPRRLCSSQRGRHVLLPRQVGMYLIRQLTGLSLEQIGGYFGGRDHSTVLHACRKVESAIGLDPVLSGTIRQLRAELT